MSDALRFIIPGEMRGKGRPRFSARGGFARAYTDAKTVSTENWVKACAAEAMAGRPLLAGPVHLSMAITVAIPASWPKRKQAAATAGEIMPTGKPDADNCVKLVSDALNGLVWRDDSQIVALAVTKTYGQDPRTEIAVAPMLAGQVVRSQDEALAAVREWGWLR